MDSIKPAVKYFPFRAASSANQIDTAIIPCEIGRQIAIKRLYALGAHANAQVRCYVARASGRTTVYAAAAYNATAINLVGDAGVKKTLRGRVVTTSDFALVNTLLGGWVLLDIATLTAGTNGLVDIGVFTCFDGKSTLGVTAGNGAAAGEEAYIIWSEDVFVLPVGAAAVTYEYPCAGELNRPMVVGIVAGDATAHRITGLAEYV